MDRKRLEWVEFGRGCAALAVVICHFRFTLVETPEAFHFVDSWGLWGVSYFFALSGFIIAYIHQDDLGKPDKAGIFAWRRFVRIFPTYWLILVANLLARQFLGNPDYVLHITSSFLASNFFLIPGYDLFLPVAWTLRHEMLFYAVFLIGIVNRTVGTILFALWMLIVVFSLGTQDSKDGLWLLISSHYNLYFLVGILAHQAFRKWKISFVRAPPYAVFLGSISYSLYLCHLLAMEVTHGLVKRLGVQIDWKIQIVLGAIACFAAAWLVTVFFEKPLLPRLQRLMVRKSRSVEKELGASSECFKAATKV